MPWQTYCYHKSELCRLTALTSESSHKKCSAHGIDVERIDICQSTLHLLHDRPVCPVLNITINENSSLVGEGLNVLLNPTRWRQEAYMSRSVPGT